MATKTNAKKADTKSESKASSTPRKASLQSQVTEFIKAAGTKGTDAVAIAGHLNLIDPSKKLEDMDKHAKTDRAKQLKKVRVLARKAVGGASQTRDGKSAIYVIG